MPLVLQMGNELLAGAQKIAAGSDPQAMSSLLMFGILAGLSLFFIVLSNIATRRAHRKSGSALLSFLYGNAVHFLLIVVFALVVQFGVPYFAKNVPDDMSFAVGLLLSLAFSAAIFMFFIGFVLCQVFLLMGYLGPREIATKRISIPWQILVVIIALLAASSAFNLWHMPAVMTKKKELCYLIHSTRARANCIVEVTTGEPAADAGDGAEGAPQFVLTPMDEFERIKNLTDVGGKLAYVGERPDKTEAIVYDGTIVSGAYTHFSPLPIRSIGGTLAYDVYENFSATSTERPKSFIVFDGQEIGKGYDRAWNPTEVGGTLAYVAQRGEKYFIIWNGKEYGTENDSNREITDIGGKLAYIGVQGTGNAKREFVIFDGKRVGEEYANVRWLNNRDGHLLFMVAKPPAKEALVFNGDEYGAEYTSLIGSPVVARGKLAFQASKNGTSVVVYDGKEYGAEYKSISGLQVVNDSLMYYVRSEDGSGQIFRDGAPFSDVIPQLAAVAISKEGRIAYATGEEKGDKTVFLDGKEVFKGGVSNFWFEGEKLAFYATDDRVKFLWYDGHRVGEGMYGFNYLTTVAGKLVGAPFAAGQEKSKYYLLEEK
jgi:hypothetical protein